MAKKGWVVDDPDAVLERVLADDDVVVRQLRTKKGRAFWQEIRHLPGGIDRLDRIARMPQGKANVRDLIQKIPNGSSWIEGLSTTRRGERTGTQLSQSRSGRDFNQPTGRIYTADALLEALAGRVIIDSDRKDAGAASTQTATQADSRCVPTPYGPPMRPTMRYSLTSRREFLKQSAMAAAAASTVPYFAWSPRAFANASPNDRPRIGCIGMGGMGMGDAHGHAKFGDIVAVCDVDCAPCRAGQERRRTSARARPTPMATTARCSNARTSTW